jgi:hypothetical protein
VQGDEEEEVVTVKGERSHGSGVGWEVVGVGCWGWLGAAPPCIAGSRVHCAAPGLQVG